MTHDLTPLKPKLNQPIGVFDSGVGGLSVLKELINDYPEESFIYLGDTARLPYGTKSSSAIAHYAQRNLNFLIKHFNIKALVVACNSASTVLDLIDSPIPLLGVIKPGVRAALEVLEENEKIGLWATQATVLSGSYEKEIQKFIPNCKIQMVSCPTLVTLVEEGLDQHPLLHSAFDYYFKKFKDPIDILILGCTHFPLFKEILKKEFPKIKLIDSPKHLSKDLKEQLNLKTKKLNPSTNTPGFNSSSELELGEIKIFLSDKTKNFKNFAEAIFKKPFFQRPLEIKKINIE